MSIVTLSRENWKRLSILILQSLQRLAVGERQWGGHIRKKFPSWNRIAFLGTLWACVSPFADSVAVYILTIILISYGKSCMYVCSVWNIHNITFAALYWSLNEQFQIKLGPNILFYKNKSKTNGNISIIFFFKSQRKCFIVIRRMNTAFAIQTLQHFARVKLTGNWL